MHPIIVNPYLLLSCDLGVCRVEERAQESRVDGLLLDSGLADVVGLGVFSDLEA